MAVMSNEDPALPEVSEDEAWYDAEIAPALAALAKRCHERGMAFVAVVEYQPGDRAGTYYMTEDAGLAMTRQPPPVVCGNCDTALPEGCGGLFKDDGKHCRLNAA